MGDSMRMEIHYAGHQAGLYVDGKLIEIGDARSTERMALNLANVLLVDDDAFMRGQRHHDGAAQNLDEVATFRTVRAHRKRVAAELLRQSDELAAKARRVAAGQD
jgi:hypothetical protein